MDTSLHRVHLPEYLLGELLTFAEKEGATEAMGAALYCCCHDDAPEPGSKFEHYLRAKLGKDHG